jgi:PPOX class probable F420-dependent enzyme
MAAKLSANVKRLLTEPNFGNVATLMPDGTPQVTPVWVDTDGTHVLFNTAEGRQKTRNLHCNPQVAISVFDRNNPYTWAEIRGRVAEMTHDGADEHIDKLAKKYLGKDTYPFRQPGEQRVIVKILPGHVSSSGGE